MCGHQATAHTATVQIQHVCHPWSYALCMVMVWSLLKLRKSDDTQKQSFIWPSLLMVSWIVRDFTQLSIKFYRLHACQLSTVPGWGGVEVEGGWPFDLFAPAIVRTKPIQTLIIQECSRTINTRDTAEWNGFHAHTFQTRIFRFFGSHTYSYFLYCCRGTTARDVASSSLSLARRISLVL